MLNMLQRPNRASLHLGRLNVWAVVAALVLLQACSTAQIDAIPHVVGGLPEGAPQRPAEAPSYPAVHDMPPPRAVLLDTDQQKKLHDELIATRNRQPNQQKNIARDKERAAKQAKKEAEDKKKPKARNSRNSDDQPTSLFRSR